MLTGTRTVWFWPTEASGEVRTEQADEGNRPGDSHGGAREQHDADCPAEARSPHVLAKAASDVVPEDEDVQSTGEQESKSESGQHPGERDVDVAPVRVRDPADQPEEEESGVCEKQTGPPASPSTSRIETAAPASASRTGENPPRLKCVTPKTIPAAAVAPANERRTIEKPARPVTMVVARATTTAAPRVHAQHLRSAERITGDRLHDEAGDGEGSTRKNREKCPGSRTRWTTRSGTLLFGTKVAFTRVPRPIG